MSIVISNKIRMVMTDSDTTNFDYGTNQATEISILGDITIDRSMNSMTVGASGVSATSNRVSTIINTGYSGTKLTFKTYLKPVTDSGNVSSPEKLLWESLAATDVADTASTSTVAFTSGNTNTLRELYFYLIFEDDSYYQIKQGVVASCTIDLDISKITTATWEILALDMLFEDSVAVTGTAKDMTSATFIRNKLSTVALNLSTVDYDLAVLKANIQIKNLVHLIGRTRVGVITEVSGHYVADRTTSVDLSFYLNDKVDGSSDLITELLSYTNLEEINTTSNVVLSIGGSTNALKIDVNMPTSKLLLKNPKIGLYNTVDIQVIPQESNPGDGDEIELIYNN